MIGGCRHAAAGTPKTNAGFLATVGRTAFAILVVERKSGCVVDADNKNAAALGRGCQVVVRIVLGAIGAKIAAAAASGCRIEGGG